MLPYQGIKRMKKQTRSPHHILHRPLRFIGTLVACLSLGTSIAIFSTTASVFAQESPTGNSFSLSVSPPVSYVTLKPGELFVASITLENQGTSSVNVTPSLVDFEPDKEGTGITLNDFSTFPYIDTTQPTQLQQTIRLQPGQKQKISIPIRVPLSAGNSEHHLTVLFPGIATDDVNATPTGANVSGVIGSNMIVMVSPNIQDLSQLSLEKYDGVYLVDSFAPISFKLWAKNEGVLAGVASGSAQIITGSGRVVSTWAFFPDIILAHSNRLLRTTGENVSTPDDDIQPTSVFTYKSTFLLGAYRVNVTFGSANQLNRTTTSYPVIAFPFILTGLGLVCAILIIGYKFLLRKLPIGKGFETY